MIVVVDLLHGTVICDDDAIAAEMVLDVIMERGFGSVAVCV